ncbi:hypothetical protein B296_00058137 [Ensete ventricosum]|uniref:Uncharacterized protein n=1 Tax=Ensete ventricosum TaxID=4639 RepID=A0A426XNI9_ENSVE|nr:hypothetical protein B296_00058137 [Ensete ventricosum]
MSYLDVLHNLTCAANWLIVIQIFGPYYHLYKHCFQFFTVETSFCPACSLSGSAQYIILFFMLVRAICLHSCHLMFVGFIPSLIINRQRTFWLSI